MQSAPTLTLQKKLLSMITPTVQQKLPPRSLSNLVAEKCQNTNTNNNNTNDNNSLTISYTFMQKMPIAIKKIFEDHFQNVIELTIINCDLRTFENFPKMKMIQNLNVSKNSLRGSFEFLVKNRTLKYIDASNNMISQIKKFQPLRCIKNVHLYAKFNPFDPKSTQDSQTTPKIIQQMKMYGIKYLQKPLLRPKKQKSPPKKQQKPVKPQPQAQAPPLQPNPPPLQQNMYKRPSQIYESMVRQKIQRKMLERSMHQHLIEEHNYNMLRSRLMRRESEVSGVSGQSGGDRNGGGSGNGNTGEILNRETRELGQMRRLLLPSISSSSSQQGNQNNNNNNNNNDQNPGRGLFERMQSPIHLAQPQPSPRLSLRSNLPQPLRISHQPQPQPQSQLQPQAHCQVEPSPQNNAQISISSFSQSEQPLLQINNIKEFIQQNHEQQDNENEIDNDNDDDNDIDNENDIEMDMDDDNDPDDDGEIDHDEDQGQGQNENQNQDNQGYEEFPEELMDLIGADNEDQLNDVLEERIFRGRALRGMRRLHINFAHLESDNDEIDIESEEEQGEEEERHRNPFL